MGRKYLEDLGHKPGYGLDEDNRNETWKEQRSVYGFDEREIWDISYSFYEWLYEHLKMYQDTAVIDATYHKIEFKGKEYTQEELTNKLLERLEKEMVEDFNSGNIDEIATMFSKLLPYLWC